MNVKQEQEVIEEVTYQLEILPEDCQVAGNAMASGDLEVDQAAEQAIYDQLDAGNECAWFCARVVAEWRGVEGDTYLGCCSYESRLAFTQNPQFQDMKEEALGYLLEKINRTQL